MLWHVGRYPLLEAADLYKLAHQGAAGPGHAIPEPETARAWLRREWEEIGPPRDGETVREPLPGEEGNVRLNLRPWKESGGSADAVHAAFVEAAGRITATPEELRRRLDRIVTCLAGMAETGEVPVPAREIRAYFAERRRAGYPAVHHSDRYRESYEPAYRVVASGALGP